MSALTISRDIGRVGGFSVLQARDLVGEGAGGTRPRDRGRGRVPKAVWRASDPRSVCACLRLVACIGSISAVELVLAPRVTGLIVGLSASPRAPHPAGCHSAGVGNARRGPFVVGTVRAGLGDSQPWVGTGTLLTRLRACLRARLRALMRLLRAIRGSRSAVFRERV